MIVVVALVIIKVATGGTTTPPGKTTFQPTSAAVLTDLTTIPASVFNSVGINSPITSITPPQSISGQSELYGTNASGQKVPEILYMGAEYCPYCAAQRWATIVALSRFGTWSGLGDLTVGQHTGIAIGEWHVHAWDLARASGTDHRPSDASTVSRAAIPLRSPL